MYHLISKMCQYFKNKILKASVLITKLLPELDYADIFGQTQIW